jgi:hypothetical protein
MVIPALIITSVKGRGLGRKNWILHVRIPSHYNRELNDPPKKRDTVQWSGIESIQVLRAELESSSLKNIMIRKTNELEFLYHPLYPSFGFLFFSD